jgi:tripartite ATP-independent transporter DctP family solute receptor
MSVRGSLGWKLAGLCLIALLGLGAVSPGSAAAGEVITIKFGNSPSLDDPECLGALRFGELAEKKTGGRVKVQVYPLSQLGAQREMLEGLRLGTIEMTMVTVGFMSSYDPFLNIFELPFLYRDHFHSYKVFDGPIGDDVKKRIESKTDFKPLAYFEAGIRHMTNSRRPINTPEDLKGLKIRVPQSKVNMDALAAMGATPVAMAFPEIYSALQQKVVDGQENPYTMPWNAKFYEAQKYLSKTGHMLLTHTVVYSKKLWQQLPADIQAALQESANEAKVYQREQVRLMEDKMKGLLVEKGGMVYNEANQDAFRKAVEPMYAKYVKEYGPEAAAFIKRIQETK